MQAQLLQLDLLDQCPSCHVSYSTALLCFLLLLCPAKSLKRAAYHDALLVSSTGALVSKVALLYVFRGPRLTASFSEAPGPPGQPEARTGKVCFVKDT